uniref:NADH dehydrogenase subunit 6 n=1 Tax=Archaeocroton sphenodonti TaxID=2599316 RepID=H9M784_9ACAR|nr:NADH dehydrogenase subunit 6 [Archaeocroton sphenodonti]AET63101.1 NADH dehydrogenase subunit 6 [Archaeocroton sphenodonti]
MEMLTLLTVITMFMSHPMMMLMSVMLLTFFLALIFYKITQISLVSLMMILLILGGMLIIFMYMISLCPNKKIIFKKISLLIIIFMIPTISMFHILMKFEISNFIKIYFFNFLNLLILMMIYLLITLLVVMKNSNFNNSPMKLFI